MDEYSSGRSAGEHMHRLLEGLEALKQEFADSPEILGDIKLEIETIQEWVAKRTAEPPNEKRPARVFGDVEADDHLPVQTRGIFGDVDE